MFTVTREVPLPPEEAWRRLSDLGSHSDGVPLTSTTADAGEPTVGWRFTARTVLGPLRFDDPMVVEAWEPPRRWRVVKTGPLRGWAELEVTPTGTGSRVTWSEELGLRPRPIARLSTAVGDVAGRIVFGRVLDSLLRAPR